MKNTRCWIYPKMVNVSLSDKSCKGTKATNLKFRFHEAQRQVNPTLVKVTFVTKIHCGKFILAPPPYKHCSRHSHWQNTRVFSFANFHYTTFTFTQTLDIMTSLSLSLHYSNFNHFHPNSILISWHDLRLMLDITSEATLWSSSLLRYMSSAKPINMIIKST